MYLRIIGDSFTEHIFKEIEAITNHGTLHLNRVDYNKEKKMISIPIERYTIDVVKKKFLGTVTSYKYDKNLRIPSLVIIRNVTGCKIENNFDDPNILTITMLFGLNIKDSEIYISSVEEDKGIICYSLTTNVDGIDIEIRDQSETIPL